MVPPPTADPTLEVTVLGSGTLVPDDDRRSAAFWVEGDGLRLLLDCGSGAVHGATRHGVPWSRLSHVAISHFHTDHVGDLAPFLWALHHGTRPPREEPLTVLGPPGIRRFIDRLASAFGTFAAEPRFPLEVVELPRRGGWAPPSGDFHLECHPTPHTEESVAYRVEAGGGTVAYTGDTGPSRELGGFLRGAELLVAECAVPDPTDVEIHLSPSSLAELARIAEPGLLLVTHCYPEVPRDRLPDLLKELGYTGRCLVPARDGIRIRVSRKGAELVEEIPRRE